MDRKQKEYMVTSFFEWNSGTGQWVVIPDYIEQDIVDTVVNTFKQDEYYTIEINPSMPIKDQEGNEIGFVTAYRIN